MVAESPATNQERRSLVVRLPLERQVSRAGEPEGNDDDDDDDDDDDGSDERSRMKSIGMRRRRETTGNGSTQLRPIIPLDRFGSRPMTGRLSRRPPP